MKKVTAFLHFWYKPVQQTAPWFCLLLCLGIFNTGFAASTTVTFSQQPVKETTAAHKSPNLYLKKNATLFSKAHITATIVVVNKRPTTKRTKLKATPVQQLQHNTVSKKQRSQTTQQNQLIQKQQPLPASLSSQAVGASGTTPPSYQNPYKIQKGLTAAPITNLSVLYLNTHTPPGGAIAFLKARLLATTHSTRPPPFC